MKKILLLVLFLFDSFEMFCARKYDPSHMRTVIYKLYSKRLSVCDKESGKRVLRLHYGPPILWCDMESGFIDTGLVHLLMNDLVDFLEVNDEISEEEADRHRSCFDNIGVGAVRNIAWAWHDFAEDDHGWRSWYCAKNPIVSQPSKRALNQTSGSSDKKPRRKADDEK